MTAPLNPPAASPVQPAIETLAQACGLEAASMPTDAPGLVIETEAGLFARIEPHPWDRTRMTVDIEFGDLGALLSSASDPATSARMLQALFDLGDALADCSAWRLGLDDDLHGMLSSTLVLSPHFDATDAIRVIEEGLERARAARTLSIRLSAGPGDA